MQVLTGDMLLAAAFVSYAGPFTSIFRTDLIKQFLDFMKAKNTPMTQGLTDPLKVLVDEAIVASWVKEGLPSDPTSVQNGTILNNSERWPLIMDPQLQGIVWIKEREAKNDLRVVRMEDDKKARRGHCYCLCDTCTRIHRIAAQSTLTCKHVRRHLPGIFSFCTCI